MMVFHVSFQEGIILEPLITDRTSYLPPTQVYIHVSRQRTLGREHGSTDITFEFLDTRVGAEMGAEDTDGDKVTTTYGTSVWSLTWKFTGKINDKCEFVMNI